MTVVHHPSHWCNSFILCSALQSGLTALVSDCKVSCWHNFIFKTGCWKENKVSMAGITQWICTLSPPEHLLGHRCILVTTALLTSDNTAHREDETLCILLSSDRNLKTRQTRLSALQRLFHCIFTLIAKLSSECPALWCTWLLPKAGQPEEEQRSTSGFPSKVSQFG